MSTTFSNTLLLGALSLGLAACGTTPTAVTLGPTAPAVLSTLSAGSGTYVMAEATGRIGAWASGSIGAWASNSQTSTVSDGQLNTFQANLPMWSQVHLSGAQSAAPTLGTGVTVAVIDTGIDLSHPAFSGHLAPARNMRDLVGNDAVPQEEGSSSDMAYGHGTAVASLILQVAPNATILPIRVLSPDGSGQASTVASGIDWAVAHGAKIINLSVVSSVDSTLRTSIENATNKGVYVVMAAGNNSASPVMYPSRFANIEGSIGAHSLSVGSIETSDAQSDFSNYGQQLKVLAPGRLMTVAYPGSLTAQATGTSFATPVVSGVLALGASKGINSSSTLTDTLKAAVTNVTGFNTQYLETGSTALRYGLLNAQAFVNNVK